MGTAVTLVGRGPNGETIVAENETAMDLYLFKHNLPAYDRPTPKAAKAADFPASKFGIRVYADASTKENKDEATGIKSADSGVGVDVKRTYFTFTHQFDKTWSAVFQSDIGDQGARRYDVFVKKAYVQAQITPMAAFRLGSADTAWIPYVEGVYGLRYVEQTITDHLSFGASADWGFHITGTSPLWGYQISAENGRGFSNPTRSKIGRLRGPGLLHPGQGPEPRRRRLQRQARPGHRRRSGQAHRHPPGRPGRLRHRSLQGRRRVLPGQELEQRHHRRHRQVRRLLRLGAGQRQPEVAVFARYDNANPSKDLKPNLEFTYYNAGLQWTLNKSFAASLVYKFAEVKGGTQGTGNGTIGSTVASSKGKYNEIGIFTVYNF